MKEAGTESRAPTARCSRAALVITGPTATGKTELAIEVARRLGGEVISMDSRQVYRGMDIGTAKPAARERRGIPHHGFDVVDPSERYSAGRFARDARRWIAQVTTRGRVPILAGGTGFFLRALTHPMFREPEMHAARREALKGWLAQAPDDLLVRWAERLDPGAARRGGGRQRYARAIEVALLTGHPLTWWHAHAAPEETPLDALVFVLEPERTTLDRAIEQRVLDMVDHGLVAEVEGLLEQGYQAHDPGMNATGYIELMPYLGGTISLEQAIADIQAATRRYARRQMTWMRRQLPRDAQRLDAALPTSELAEVIASTWRTD